MRMIITVNDKKSNSFPEVARYAPCAMYDSLKLLRKLCGCRSLQPAAARVAKERRFLTAESYSAMRWFSAS